MCTRAPDSWSWILCHTGRNRPIVNHDRWQSHIAHMVERWCSARDDTYGKRFRECGCESGALSIRTQSSRFVAAKASRDLIEILLELDTCFLGLQSRVSTKVSHRARWSSLMSVLLVGILRPRFLLKQAMRAVEWHVPEFAECLLNVTSFIAATALRWDYFLSLGTGSTLTHLAGANPFSSEFSCHRPWGWLRTDLAASKSLLPFSRIQNCTLRFVKWGVSSSIRASRNSSKGGGKDRGRSRRASNQFMDASPRPKKC